LNFTQLKQTKNSTFFELFPPIKLELSLAFVKESFIKFHLCNFNCAKQTWR
jgi:hypothetical protein